jgi:hypothetical protein
MSDLCTVVSRRQQFVDYRPAAHHKLYQQDRHFFDPRFNAYLRSETFVKYTVDRCIDQEILLTNDYVGCISGIYHRLREQSISANAIVTSVNVSPVLLPTSTAPLFDPLLLTS